MGAARVQDRDPIESIKSVLRSCQLFTGAADGVIDFVAAHVETISFAKGEPIILENENNDHVYFVAEGAVEIVSYIVDEKRVQRLALLRPGSQFAEFSVLTKSTKSGSAYAYEASHLLRLKGTHFIELLKKFPAVSSKLAADLAALNERVESGNDFVPYYQASDLKVARGITDIIPQSSWKKFGVIPLVHRGGVLSVALMDPNNDEFFQFVRGHLSGVEVNAYLIDEDDYETAFDFVKNWLRSNGSAEVRSKSVPPLPSDVKAMLSAFSLTALLPESVHAQLLPLLKPIAAKAGQIICAPKTQHDKLLLVVSGSVEVHRDIPRSKGKAHVMVVEAGETIGEVSLLTGQPSLLTYRALEDTVLVPLPKAVVMQLMSSSLVSIPLTIQLAKRLQKLNSQSGIRHFKSNEMVDLKACANLLPLPMLADNKVVPLAVHDGEVWMGIVRTNHRRLSSLLGRYLSGYRLRFFGVAEEQFRGYLDQIRSYQVSGGAEVISLRQRPGTQAQNVDPVRLLDEILLFGLKNRASDIHFEPSEEMLTVRYRVDGVLHERTESIPEEPGRAIISRIKVLSHMDIANNRITQDGQLKTTIGDVTLVARASVLPVKHGEKVVLRLVRSHDSVVPLNMLVPDRRAINILQHVAGCKQGLFLVTGPTGSGKTTTLYSLLSEINRVGINVVTLEDPVELEIPGTNQCEVDRKRGVDFAHVLAAVLRQDPDVIMVGEIRDEESAKIVFEAAVTGHLVLSTLHTSFATDVGPRLAELGVPTATIATGLLGVVTQRLVRATCRKCVTSQPTTKTERDYINSILGPVEVPEELKFGRGCSACKNTGYYDRIPVMEIWRNTSEMSKALSSGHSAAQLVEVARKDGFETLLESGVKLAVSGLTTLEEVKRCLSGI